MTGTEWLCIGMLVSFFALLMLGVPVALTLGTVGFTFGVLGFGMGLFSLRPARIHGFVYLCQPDEVREFSQQFGFLNILVNAALPIPPEELIAAALRQMSRAHDNGRAFLVAAGKELANLLSADFIRLKNILGRLS